MSIDNDSQCLEWNFATIKGKGVYMGDLLSLYNYSPAWYGEGDEKIWVVTIRSLPLLVQGRKITIIVHGLRLYLFILRSAVRHVRIKKVLPDIMLSSELVIWMPFLLLKVSASI